MNYKLKAKILIAQYNIIKHDKYPETCINCNNSELYSVLLCTKCFHEARIHSCFSNVFESEQFTSFMDKRCIEPTINDALDFLMLDALKEKNEY